MKKFKILFPLISIFILLFLIFMLLGDWDISSLTSRFWNSKSSVSMVEEELQRLAVLNTAEYRMRLIFPYDFIEGSADWVMYKNIWDLNPHLFDSKTDPAEYVDGVLPQEWKNGLFYRECRELGIDPFKFRYDFLVLSVVVKAGTNMELIENLYSLPNPEITDLIIEDLDNSKWGYPDPPVSPEELRRMVEFLSPRIEEIALREGIIDIALQKRERMIQGFLAQTGYGEE